MNRKKKRVIEIQEEEQKKKQLEREEAETSEYESWPHGHGHRHGHQAACGRGRGYNSGINLQLLDSASSSDHVSTLIACVQFPTLMMMATGCSVINVIVGFTIASCVNLQPDARVGSEEWFL